MSQEPWYVRFARTFGWRAYAIPVLAVITVWLLVDVFAADDPADELTEGFGGKASATRSQGPDPAEQKRLRDELGKLPDGGDYAELGNGEFRQIGRPGASAGEGKEKTIRYVIEVEGGVDTASSGGDEAVARMIDATLTNPAGWAQDERFRFEHVAAKDNPTMRIQLTSVGTTHEVCGVDVDFETSCFFHEGNRVVINDARWVRGATPFQGDIGSYRQYVINHEVGHGLGYARHQPCGAEDGLAPVMMQQTLSLNNKKLSDIGADETYTDSDLTCRYNPWPYPRAKA